MRNWIMIIAIAAIYGGGLSVGWYRQGKSEGKEECEEVRKQRDEAVEVAKSFKKSAEEWQKLYDDLRAMNFGSKTK